MGAFYRFELTRVEDWINKYNIKNYVETGFGDLTSFRYAANCPFNKFYGVDFDEGWFNNAVNNCGSNCRFWHGLSTQAIPVICSELEGNTCWFLDAHFAGGADYGKCTQAESIQTYERSSLPLEDEIKLIKSNRDISNDIFVLDDYMIYDENCNCEWARQHCFPERELAKSLNIDVSPDWLYKAFEDTHNIEIDLRDQGYFVATPK